MLIGITGGGTGGHIYPALEVARDLMERGADIRYYGSFRGQEQAICGRLGVPFTGFNSRALYSLRSMAGWQSIVLLAKATVQAKAALRNDKPDAVFSTGGYSAAPIMAAARSLGIPYTIHESNSVPGRANRLFAKGAAGFTCTFKKTLTLIPQAKRTGQPIRRELREAAIKPNQQPMEPFVISVGGSQGSQFLNETVPAAASHLITPARILLAAGRSNFDKLPLAPQNVEIVPYLEADRLVHAYASATVAVARSGGTIAEFAMFGLPSVLVPLPTSADDHQLVNAQEFVQFGGALLLEQKNASPEKLAEAVDEWHNNPTRRENASRALKNWDQPDATQQIAEITWGAATRHN